MASRQERGRGGHCRPEEDARRPGAARPPAAGSARPAGGGLPLLAPRRRAGAIAALRGSRRGGAAAEQPPGGAWAGGGSAAQNFPGSSVGCPGGAAGEAGGDGPRSHRRPDRSAHRRPGSASAARPQQSFTRKPRGCGPISVGTTPWLPSAPNGTRRRRADLRGGWDGTAAGERGRLSRGTRTRLLLCLPRPGKFVGSPRESADRSAPLPPGPAGRSASSAGSPRAAVPAAPPERRFCSAPGSAPPGSTGRSHRPGSAGGRSRRCGRARGRAVGIAPFPAGVGVS